MKTKYIFSYTKQPLNTLLEIVGFDLILYIIVLNFAIKASFLYYYFFQKKIKRK